MNIPYILIPLLLMIILYLICRCKKSLIFKIKEILNILILLICTILVISYIFSISSISFTKKNNQDVEYIEKNNVQMEKTQGFNYIKISKFYKGTANNFNKKLKNFADEKKFILDLRDNPGGLLTEVISVAELIMDEGVITKIKYKESVMTYEIKEKKQDNKFFIILVNQNTASAAETLTAALRDNDQATIVGQTTFGKGYGQIMKNAGRLQLKVAIFYWYTPSGYNINKKGINPDYIVENKSLQLKKAIELYNR